MTQATATAPRFRSMRTAAVETTAVETTAVETKALTAAAAATLCSRIGTSRPLWCELPVARGLGFRVKS